MTICLNATIFSSQDEAFKVMETTFYDHYENLLLLKQLIATGVNPVALPPAVVPPGASPVHAGGVPNS